MLYEANSKTNAKRPLSQNFTTERNFFHKIKVVELTSNYCNTKYQVSILLRLVLRVVLASITLQTLSSFGNFWKLSLTLRLDCKHKNCQIDLIFYVHLASTFYNSHIRGHLIKFNTKATTISGFQQQVCCFFSLKKLS